jgi:uncharacterized protein involved in exopolysaccharide biosynthesis
MATIDRSAVSRALAKAIAFKQCGRDDMAREAGDLKGRAEALRAQCAELSAQVSAIAAAITASRQP